MATTSVSCRRENLSDTKIQATKLQRLAERREARRAQRGREKKARARARTAAAAARGGDTCEDLGGGLRAVRGGSVVHILKPTNEVCIFFPPRKPSASPRSFEVCVNY